MPTLPVNHFHSEMLSKFCQTNDRNKLNAHAKVDKNDGYHDIGNANEKNSLNCSLMNYYDSVNFRNSTANELSCQLHIGYDSISFDTSIFFSNSNSFFLFRLSRLFGILFELWQSNCCKYILFCVISIDFKLFFFL